MRLKTELLKKEMKETEIAGKKEERFSNNELPDEITRKREKVAEKIRM